MNNPFAPHSLVWLATAAEHGQAAAATPPAGPSGQPASVADHTGWALPPVLRCMGYGVAFGERVILAELHFTVPGAGVTALMGPPGTGKSTLLRSLARLNLANSRFREWGEVQYERRRLQDGEAPALVLQQMRVPGATAFDMLAERVRASHDALSPLALRGRILALLQDFGCDDLQPWLDQPCIALPTAAQRRLRILAEAAAGPALLMLDEPTGGLTEPETAQLLALITALGARLPVLVVLHNQRQVRQVAQQVLLMAGGRIQADLPVAEFFDHPPNDVARQFVRTGSCGIASPDTPPELLESPADAPPPLPAAALQALAPAAPQAPALPPPTHVPTRAPVAPPAPALSASLLALASPPEYRGPRGFRWVVPGRLATAPMPGVVVDLDHDLAALKGVGVTTVISLTRRELPVERLAAHGLSPLHLPIYDREAPTIAQLRMLAIRITRLIQQGEVLVVHCRAGLGRTGTVVAGWLIHEGLTAAAALERLRAIDRAYVQTSEQEAFLQAYEASVLLRL